jgi:3-methyladenine DNA glycosylase AlkD
MTTKEIMTELSKLGSAQTKKTFANHGAPEPMFGVKVGDMKSIVKKIKMDYQLSLELYDTGNSDAMYLAGLISDPKKMTKKDLQHWAETATWHMITEYSVAWTTAESPFALEMAKKWIKSKEEKIACAGWNTYSSYLGITETSLLDLKELKELLDHIQKNISKAPNRVKYVMNGFVIAVGGNVRELTEHAKKVAKAAGVIHVEMGGTACKVPSAPEYIDKMIARGMPDKKRKTAKC